MRDQYHSLITQEPIEVTQAWNFVKDDASGAVSHFLGVVRNHNQGKSVIGIAYEVCEPLATHTLNQIAQEAMKRFKGLKVYLTHFSGYLNVGEVSMLVSTSTPHRDECYKANRYVVEAIKHRCPVWKKEYYADNTESWVKGCKIEHEHL